MKEFTSAFSRTALFKINSNRNIQACLFKNENWTGCCDVMYELHPKILDYTRLVFSPRTLQEVPMPTTSKINFKNG